MEPSKVYFSDLRALPGTNLLIKLQKLAVAAGLDNLPLDKRFAAIKIHFGEPGNLSYLRPNYAKVLADAIRERGGKPFVTDCNTLYAGRRKDALEHIDSAFENGYTPYSCGCHVIIADGLKGTDDVEVPVAGGEYVKNAKIGRAIIDADVIISLNHFKGHEQTGFGGAIKNIGMGCGSRAGKMEQHSCGKPYIKTDKCVGCRFCAKQCAHGAIRFGEDHKASIDESRCVGCGRCIGVCAHNAVSPRNDAAPAELCKRMAEYAKAVLDGRPQLHISLVVDVSPYCDCHGENDLAVIPNVGMFASADPVALDQACADACNAMPVIPGSLLDEHLHDETCRGGDHFHTISPNTDWEVCLAHAEKLGIGTRRYELVTIK